MLSDSSDGVQASGLERFLGPLVSSRSYRNLVFLLVRLPLGIAYFTTFFTGLVLGVVLTPLGVGVPFLGVVIGFTDYAARFEATVSNWLLDTDLTYVPIHDPHEEPLVPYVKSTLTEPRSYLLVAYFLVSLPVAIGTFTFVLTAFTIGVVLLLAPVAAVTPDVEYTVPDPALTGSTIAVDTLPEGLALSVVGLASLVVGVHVANAIAAAHAGGTAAVLRAV
ncbi:sensor domain-containing protein [Halorubellus salinus]|uniref:sensor domain-containing protein n=1 Tax=Halorubellus salinus TaxID=755309 RepID=UPI001D08A361|nr:sensor domain-containing protein [Halorubellus salinus]